MNEFVYKLNLPLLPEILLDSAKKSLFNQTRDSFCYLKPLNIVKPEWLTVNSYNWNNILHFYKNNTTGVIHMDDKDVLNQAWSNWGINWIHGNSGIMEYWLLQDVVLPSVSNDKVDRIVCTTAKKPHRTYYMSEGAYLVNASFPHRATALGSRYAFSLRDTTCFETWDTVVDKFKNYIT